MCGWLGGFAGYFRCPNKGLGTAHIRVLCLDFVRETRLVLDTLIVARLEHLVPCKVGHRKVSLLKPLNDGVARHPTVDNKKERHASIYFVAGYLA